MRKYPLLNLLSPMATVVPMYVSNISIGELFDLARTCVGKPPTKFRLTRPSGLVYLGYWRNISMEIESPYTEVWKAFIVHDMRHGKTCLLIRVSRYFSKVAWLSMCIINSDQWLFRWEGWRHKADGVPDEQSTHRGIFPLRDPYSNKFGMFSPSYTKE